MGFSQCDITLCSVDCLIPFAVDEINIILCGISLSSKSAFFSSNVFNNLVNEQLFPEPLEPQNTGKLHFPPEIYLRNLENLRFFVLIISDLDCIFLENAISIYLSRR